MIRPATTLRPGSHKDYVEQAQGGLQRERMELAERRRLVLEGDWRPLVWALLFRYAYTDTVRNAVAARVKRAPNIALKALRKVAIAYKIAPTRTIHGASEATEKAFKRLVLEHAGLLTEPQRWELLVWGLSKIITVPVVRPNPAGVMGIDLKYELLLPSNTEVVTRTDNPLEPPIASVTTYNAGEVLGSRDKTVFTILDEEAWTTYDGQGRFLQRAPHNAGVYPGTTWFRLRGQDWWGRDLGEGLFDATVEAAHHAARRDWHRQGQDHKREILFAEEIDTIGKQVSGSDGAIEVPLGPNEAEYKVLDPTISVTQHLEHITALAREGVDAIGIDPDLMDFQPGADAIEPLVAAQKHDDLQALRRSTIDHFRVSEQDSAWKTALVLQGTGHPMSALLRPSVVREGYEAQWSDLDFVDEPKARMEVLELEIDMGLKSTVDAYMAQHPGLSREQAWAEVRRIDEEEAERAEFLAERNLPRLVRDRRSNVAELQGRIGGMTSGEARQPQEDDDDGISERSTSSGARERGAGSAGTGATSLRAGTSRRGRARRR